MIAEPYLLEMIYRMREGEDAAYDFFEYGPKGYGMNNGRTYNRIESANGRRIYKKLLTRCCGSQ